MTEIDSSENYSNNISFIEDENTYKTISRYDIISVSETYKQKKTSTKKSRPYLSKFERCKILGIRAEQLTNNNVIPYVELNGNETVVEIAEKELRERKIPMIIRRYFSNGRYEDWNLNELIY